MNCLVQGTTIANLPIKHNFWRMSNTSTDILECFNKQACIGAAGPAAAAANATTSRRQLSDGLDVSTAGDVLCAPGHTGILCGACLDNWYACSCRFPASPPSS